MPHQIVISYSRRNSDIAEGLASALRERGVDYWYDRMIKPGADWRDEIANAISSAKILVILFSAESNDSQELRKELAIADRHKLLIIPVRVEEIEPKGLFEYELARRQWFDLFPDWRKALPGVVDYIAEATAGLAPPPPRAFGEPRPPDPARPAFGMPRGSEPAQEALRSRTHARAASDAATPTGQGGSPNILDVSMPRHFALPFIAILGIAGLVSAVSALGSQYNTFSLATVAYAVPVWLVGQPFLINSIGANRPGRTVAKWLAFVFAAIALFSWILPNSVPYGEIATPICALSGAGALIAILVARFRGQRAALFWLVPLFASLAVTSAYWTITDFRVLFVICNVGLFVSALFYAIVLLRSR